ncbi:hypothetical protein LAUMK35_04531 [Mycobacterium pseudokansasii]|nr:hypothetical protein LAUMK35_04531 [Mycobacterium pseudokansasii]VBA31266.1 hypothetical protein LAUMK21_04524 [Mycobacterium pseudokansasii]
MTSAGFGLPSDCASAASSVLFAAPSVLLRLRSVRLWLRACVYGFERASTAPSVRLWLRTCVCGAECASVAPSVHMRRPGRLWPAVSAQSMPPLHTSIPRAASSPGPAQLPGSFSPRFAGRIVARPSPIARLLLAPLRGPHRRQAQPNCPAPSRPASRAASSPGPAQLPGSFSPRFAGRIVARPSPIARLLLAPLRGPHRRQAKFGFAQPNGGSPSCPKPSSSQRPAHPSAAP